MEKAKLPPPISPAESLMVGLSIEQEFFIMLPIPKPGMYYDLQELPSGRYTISLKRKK